jgi:hypothetical protein
VSTLSMRLSRSGAIGPARRPEVLPGPGGAMGPRVRLVHPETRIVQAQAIGPWQVGKTAG